MNLDATRNFVNNCQNLTVKNSNTGEEMVKLWVLRLLNDPIGLVHLTSMGYFVSGVMTCIGFPDKDIGDYPPFHENNDAVSMIHREIATYLQQAESDAIDDLPLTIKANVGLLAKHFELFDVEQKLISLLLMMYRHKYFKRVLIELNDCEQWGVKHLHSVMLGESFEDVRHALSPAGNLFKFGLVSSNVGSQKRNTGFRLDLFSDCFAERMMFHADTALDLFRDHISPVASSNLSCRSFEYISHELELLKSLITETLVTKEVGCNILIYGLPGTGKTELSRVVAKEIGAGLYDIPFMDGSGQAINGLKRLQSYVLTQSLLELSASIVVFDELEDLFNDSESLFGRSTAQQFKGRITRLLEENVIPTIWITNDVKCLDPAFIRRFRLIIKVPIPPVEHRLNLVRAVSKEIGLDESQIQQVALCSDISPAVLDQSSNTIKRLKLSNDSAAKALDYLLNSTLIAQSLKPLAADKVSDEYSLFDLSLVNIKGFEKKKRLDDLVNRLTSIKSAKLCLHGPSGAGKTLFAQWVASQANKQLRTISASDILSSGVGDSETKIAEIFQDASSNDKVLLIDEVDSFLRSREMAHVSWEFSLVNEMLVQIERFPGILMVTTNYLKALDTAALRRFDLKLSFDYLTTSQALAHFKTICGREGFHDYDEELGIQLASSNNITAGDFAVVMRKSKIQPLSTAADFVDALKQECALRPEFNRRSVGFL